MEWIYAVVRADREAPADLRGVLRAPVRAVRHGRVAALTSAVDDVPEATPDEIEAHARVVQALLPDSGGATGDDEGATVVPMRFGIAAPDERAVTRDFLRRNERKLLRLLDELAGRVEINIKADGDEDAFMASAVNTAAIRRAARSDGGMPSRLALGEAVASVMQEQAAAEAAEVMRALSAHADRAVQLPIAPPLVLNASFLVRRSQLDSLLDAVDEATRRHEGRLSLRCTGPLPAYSFCDTR